MFEYKTRIAMLSAEQAQLKTLESELIGLRQGP